MLFRRFGISSKTQRISLSVIALALALLIGFLQDGSAPAPSAASQTGAAPATAAPADPPTPAAQVAAASSREQAVAQAIRWLKGQEGGDHRGHAIARHVGKSNADLRARIARDDVSVASAFYDLETAAVAIVRTVRHQPNDARVRRWLGDDASKRRLALRRTFDKPIGRIVYRSGDARDGKSAVAVLTKRRDGDRVGYRLLTAYVEP